ncbi:hypothetical protein [Jiella sp. M17.18]|uniref:hypothetical protein n=1 Tax=Jiella sp. M17.18 TaxID=3234247 RepID=UPI0034DEBDD8
MIPRAARRAALALGLAVALASCAGAPDADLVASLSPIRPVPPAATSAAPAPYPGTPPVALAAPAPDAPAPLERAGAPAEGGSGDAPDAAEIAYARATAASVFRRRPAERAVKFLPAGETDGYGLCIRSPSARGGYDYALIVLSHRLHGGAISQVDDDTPVMRRASDTRACREASVLYALLN